MKQFEKLTKDDLQQIIDKRQQTEITVSRETIEAELPELKDSEDGFAEMVKQGLGYGASITPIQNKETIRELTQANPNKFQTILFDTYLADGDIFLRENNDDEYVITIVFQN